MFAEVESDIPGNTPILADQTGSVSDENRVNSDERDVLISKTISGGNRTGG